MNVAEFWIIFSCSLFWIISSHRSRIRDINMMQILSSSALSLSGQPSRGSLLSLTKRFRSPAEEVHTAKKNLDPLSHWQIPSPSLKVSECEYRVTALGYKICLALVNFTHEEKTVEFIPTEAFIHWQLFLASGSGQTPLVHKQGWRHVGPMEQDNNLSKENMDASYVFRNLAWHHTLNNTH